MVIYHGGYVKVEKPQIIKGKYPKDFGPGFYCTHFKEQAQRWARRYETPVISTYHFDTPEPEGKQLNILHFDEMTEEWLDFIIRCRGGKEHNYDLVTGAMANDQIFNYIADFTAGILTREQFWVLAKFKRPTNQICFCTDKALKHISFVDSEELK